MTAASIDETLASRPPPAVSAGTVDLLERQIRPARDAIVRSTRFVTAEDPLYRVPWLAVLGDGGDVRPLMTAASRGSAFAPPDRPPPGANAWWCWWLTEPLVAVEWAPDLVSEPATAARWQLAEAALGLMARYRPRLPLNGFVVAVSAATLTQRPDAVADLGRRARAVIDEAAYTLRLRVPVFVIVTGLDTLSGHDATFALLPREAGDTALGRRFAEAADLGDALAETDRMIGELSERLSRVGHALVQQSAGVDPLAALTCFRAGLRDLAGGLRVMVDVLVRDNRLAQRTLLRGLYLTAPGAAAPHVADLFRRFLPADAALAKRR